MLTYTDFYTLSEPEQQAHVAAYGNLLATRNAGWFYIELYYLNDYYCEVWHQLPAVELTYLHPFTAQSRLLPYLEQISLPSGLAA